MILIGALNAEYFFTPDINEDKDFYSHISSLKTKYMVNGNCVIPNVIERSMENNTERITLNLHMSFNRLSDSIKTQIAHWDGPVSLAIVFPPIYILQSEEVYCSIKLVIIYFSNFNNYFFQLRNLQRSDPGLSLKLSAHFLFQNRNCSESEFIDEKKIRDIVCKDISKTSLSEEDKIKRMTEYPVNEARNLARNVSFLIRF